MEVDGSPEEVWDFIADPEERARAVSVVSDYELGDAEGTSATWYVDLPIPLVRKLATVHTQDATRDPPNYVRFIGRSKVMRVEGEHSIEPDGNGGAILENSFTVDGRLPGVERYFKRNLEAELKNLEHALTRRLGEE